MSDKQPFYQKTYICLFDGATFVGYKAHPWVRIQRDPILDVDIANVLDVKVCPRCCFASAEDKFFQTNSAFDNPLALDSDIVNVINNRADQRRRLAEGATTLFSRRRTPQDARIAFQLAALSSGAIFEVAPRQHAMELARVIDYLLRAAFADEQHRREALAAAVEYLEQVSESNLQGTARERALYQRVAVGILLGDAVAPDDEISDPAYLQRARDVAKRLGERL